MDANDLHMFPATVRTPEKVYKTALLSVRSGRVRLVTAEHRVIEKVADEEIFGIELGRGSRTATVTLASGESWDCRREGSCGCGNPLKRMRPDQVEAL